MKKNKLKNYLKIGIFLCAISLWNCENESIDIHQDNKATKIQVIDPLKALEEILDNTGAKRTSNSLFDDININTNAIKQLNANGSILYTFALKKDTKTQRESQSTFYTDNLNVQINADGTYTIHIFRYTPTQDWFYNPQSNTSNYSGKIQLLDKTHL